MTLITCPTLFHCTISTTLYQPLPPSLTPSSFPYSNHNQPISCIPFIPHSHPDSPKVLPKTLDPPQPCTFIVHLHSQLCTHLNTLSIHYLNPYIPYFITQTLPDTPFLSPGTHPLCTSSPFLPQWTLIPPNTPILCPTPPSPYSIEATMLLPLLLIPSSLLPTPTGEGLCLLQMFGQDPCPSRRSGKEQRAFTKVLGMLCTLHLVLYLWLYEREVSALQESLRKARGFPWIFKGHMVFPGTLWRFALYTQSFILGTCWSKYLPFGKVGKTESSPEPSWKSPALPGTLTKVCTLHWVLPLGNMTGKVSALRKVRVRSGSGGSLALPRTFAEVTYPSLDICKGLLWVLPFGYFHIFLCLMTPNMLLCCN